ncbi:phosphotransferase family protein [Streptomyces sp. JJ36]|uniref:phosphotransferase family protein n=1 Tax=Streptomyces sp. JJ36 TaxID=2736645 RepID=UPI001F2938C9|nr:phosphotransferase [Streptomyces sp. JJ36]MCF6523777.1 phosphotransferase [Streptomyces sp. JJ36]
MNRVDAGHNSPLSVRLDTPTGPLFVKGLPDTSPGRVATQRREYEIGRHLGGLAPRARWEIRAGGWYLVAFDHLDGARQADYRPGSPDLPAVAALLRSVAQHRVPGAVELRRAEQRLAAYGTREQLRHVVGGTLLHTDLNPENVLIAGGGTPRLVDWGWATVGAPWLDAAAWAVWLVAYGHTPEAAHGWAGRVPAYQRAAPAALRAYAVMASAMWEDVAAASTAPWTGTVLSAARSLASWHDRSPSRGR